jgi:hypothetical protein
LPEISDEALRKSLDHLKSCTVVILKAGQRYQPPGPDRDPEVAALIWKHGKRNASLRAAGLMPIICPIADGSELAGVGVMTVSVDEAGRIISLDPAVQAGILTYELHPTRTFPGSAL